MPEIQKLPNPKWNKYFAYDNGKYFFAPSLSQLKNKNKELNFSPKATWIRLGFIGYNPIYEVLFGVSPTKKIIDVSGTAGYADWNEIQELGYAHPIFLPTHGCFGFLNGHLILANRHHMEIMYRLMEDKGWTWDDLINAEQAWGWYERDDNTQGTINFSSDAGIIQAKTKNKCLKAFEDYFKTPFKNGGGYGGKSKKTYGGNMKMKYGKPGEWNGLKASYENTIISSLPDPPSKTPAVVPGGGKKPPKKN